MSAVKPTKERLLDAFEEIIISQGVNHATLDAVAEKAEVSKGGLIYHFASKEALVDALCERLTSLVDEDVENMRIAPEGAARNYLQTSTPTGAPLDQTILAVTLLQDARYPRAREAGRYASDSWQDALTEDLGDANLARIIKLIGDGLYYEALFDVRASDSSQPPLTPELMDILDEFLTMSEQNGA